MPDDDDDDEKTSDGRSGTRFSMWMNDVCSGATHHLQRMKSLMHSVARNSSMRSTSTVEIPEINITYTHKLSVEHARATTEADTQRPIPTMGSMCVQTHTVDLALTHLNNALSFDNATHTRTQRILPKTTKMAKTHGHPLSCFGAHELWRRFFPSSDPFSILNYSLIIIITATTPPLSMADAHTQEKKKLIPSFCNIFISAVVCNIGLYAG